MTAEWKERVDALMAYDGQGPLVSIYVPAPAGTEANESNRIRLKNALGEAREHLKGAGVADRESKRLLRPGSDFLEALAQMQRSGRTLALFVARDYWQYLDLPEALPELTTLGERFYVKPLFATHGDDRFDILALSQKRVRVLSADWQSARELPLGAVPASLTDALGEELTERHVQYHTGAGARRSRKSPIYHGQGGGDDEHKEEVALFVRRVDEGLGEVLGGCERPLVLAGVSYLLGMFREVTERSCMLDSEIAGNADALSETELHARAWPLVSEYLSKRREAAARKCQAAVDRGDGSDSIESILPAAVLGRVNSLFVAVDDCVWGRFDAQEARVERHTRREANSEDLLEMAAREVHARGGSVHAVAVERIPRGTACMASFRY